MPQPHTHAATRRTGTPSRRGGAGRVTCFPGYGPSASPTDQQGDERVDVEVVDAAVLVAVARHVIAVRIHRIILWIIRRRSHQDLNCDGVVNFLDTMAFLPHVGHWCDPLTGVWAGLEPLASVDMLEQNYPNPFNPETRIAFALTKPGRVVLRIYDVGGRPVRTLVEETLAPRTYQVTWDGRYDEGTVAPSGVYFCRLETPCYTETKKMTLLK